MKEFIITVKYVGSVVRQEIVTATCALTAINFVENTYAKGKVTLSDKGDVVKSYQWTGYEFEARLMIMELS